MKLVSFNHNVYANSTVCVEKEIFPQGMKTLLGLKEKPWCDEALSWVEEALCLGRGRSLRRTKPLLRTCGSMEKIIH